MASANATTTAQPADSSASRPTLSALGALSASGCPHAQRREEAIRRRRRRRRPVPSLSVPSRASGPCASREKEDFVSARAPAEASSVLQATRCTAEGTTCTCSSSTESPSCSRTHSSTETPRETPGDARAHAHTHISTNTTATCATESSSSSMRTRTTSSARDRSLSREESSHSPTSSSNSRGAKSHSNSTACHLRPRPRGSPHALTQAQAKRNCVLVSTMSSTETFSSARPDPHAGSRRTMCNRDSQSVLTCRGSSTSPSLPPRRTSLDKCAEIDNTFASTAPSESAKVSAGGAGVSAYESMDSGTCSRGHQTLDLDIHASPCMPGAPPEHSPHSSNAKSAQNAAAAAALSAESVSSRAAKLCSPSSAPSASTTRRSSRPSRPRPRPPLVRSTSWTARALQRVRRISLRRSRATSAASPERPQVSSAASPERPRVSSAASPERPRSSSAASPERPRASSANASSMRPRASSVASASSSELRTSGARATQTLSQVAPAGDTLPHKSLDHSEQGQGGTAGVSTAALLSAPKVPTSSQNQCILCIVEDRECHTCAVDHARVTDDAPEDAVAVASSESTLTKPASESTSTKSSTESASTKTASEPESESSSMSSTPVSHRRKRWRRSLTLRRVRRCFASARSMSVSSSPLGSESAPDAFDEEENFRYLVSHPSKTPHVGLGLVPQAQDGAAAATKSAGVCRVVPQSVKTVDASSCGADFDAVSLGILRERIGHFRGMSFRVIEQPLPLPVCVQREVAAAAEVLEAADTGTIGVCPTSLIDRLEEATPSSSDFTASLEKTAATKSSSEDQQQRATASKPQSNSDVAASTSKSGGFVKSTSVNADVVNSTSENGVVVKSTSEVGGGVELRSNDRRRYRERVALWGSKACLFIDSDIDDPTWVLRGGRSRDWLHLRIGSLRERVIRDLDPYIRYVPSTHRVELVHAYKNYNPNPYPRADRSEEERYVPQAVDLSTTYPFLSGKKWINARLAVFSKADVSALLRESGLYADVSDLVVGYCWSGEWW